MLKKTPLRESKQSLTQTKIPTQNLKQTCKPSKSPLSGSIQTKKENLSQILIAPSKVITKVTKQPTNLKKQLTNRSIKLQGNQKIRGPSMMSEVKQQLYPCKQCGRTFVETALKRHQKICKKIFINKRKEFNSAKQRFATKDQLNLYKKNKDNFEQKAKVQKPNLMPIWKQQSMAFRLAMKQIRGGEKTKEQLEYLQKQKKIMKSNMFKCKFCGRSFNQESGKRHEGFCAQKAKDMSNKNKKK